MKKPSYTYDDFKLLWTQLLKEDRATLNNVVFALGGSKGTASKYRAQYETEQKDEAMHFINSIELPEKIIEILAGLNVKKVKALSDSQSAVEKHLKEVQSALENTTAEFEAERNQWKTQKGLIKDTKLTYEKRIAVLEERLNEREKSQQKLQSELQLLQTQLSVVTTKAAVAEKEVDLLKAQLK